MQKKIVRILEMTICNFAAICIAFFLFLLADQNANCLENVCIFGRSATKGRQNINKFCNCKFSCIFFADCSDWSILKKTKSHWCTLWIFPFFMIFVFYKQNKMFVCISEMSSFRNKAICNLICKQIVCICFAIFLHLLAFLGNVKGKKDNFAFFQNFVVFVSSFSNMF